MERKVTDITVEPKALFNTQQPENNNTGTQDVKKPKKIKKLGTAVEKEKDDNTSK